MVPDVTYTIDISQLSGTLVQRCEDSIKESVEDMNRTGKDDSKLINVKENKKDRPQPLLFPLRI